MFYIHYLKTLSLIKCWSRGNITLGWRETKYSN